MPTHFHIAILGTSLSTLTVSATATPGTVTPASYNAPVISHMAQTLELALAHCSSLETPEKPPNPTTPPTAPPIPIPSLLAPLYLATQEVLEKRCQWSQLSAQGQLLVKTLAPGTIPLQPIVTSPQVSKENKLLPPQLWGFYKTRNWALLLKESTELLKNKKGPQRGCQMAAMMKSVALARRAREGQDRATFLVHQKAVVMHMENKQCTHTLLEATPEEWQDFLLDNGLWLARLLWQSGQGAQGEVLAKKAYARAIKWGRWPFVFEAQQVLYGQIGFERMGPVALAQAIEVAVKNWTHNGALADKARLWLNARGALAWYHSRQYKKAKGLLEPIDTAMAKFWLLKIALAQGQSPQQLQHMLAPIVRLDPFSYHDLEARRLLNTPLPPPPPSRKPTWDDILPFLGAVAHRNADTVSLLAMAFHKDTQQHTLFWDAVYAQTFATFPPDALPLLALYGVERNRPTQTVQALTPLLVSGKFDGTHILFRWLFPMPFAQDMEKAVEHCPVPPHELYGVMRQESLFDTQATSPGVGALGLLQLMLTTARKTLKEPQLTRAQILEPATNLRAGACYFASLKARYPQHVLYAVGAYNAGEERMDAWVKRRSALKDLHFFTEMVPFGETRIYIQKVLRNIAIYQWLEGESLQQ